MKIHIHRGQKQIGGSIVEISTGATRIFLDVGVNLDGESRDNYPNIEGVFSGEKSCDAIFISHYHSDHIGLLEYVIKGIPVYMGEKAYKVYAAAANYRNQEVTFFANFLYDNQKITIGDISLTPFQCDHSAFDSYMFLIEADHKTILYTGDFRANGRLDFQKLLDNIPEVDAVIIEGTTLSRESEKENIEEKQLEDIAAKCLETSTGPAFIMMSAMNVERMVTAYNVARRTKRVFLEDIYTADIACAAGDMAPRPNIADGVRVFTTGGTKQYDKLVEYGVAKIGKHEISKKPFLMCVRQSMKNYLEKLYELLPFDNGVLFYGMWKGYMEQPELKEFLDFMKDKGVKIHVLHTSGHADGWTIDKLIKDICPKIIIPIHTENEQWYAKYSDRCTVICETNVIELESSRPR